MFQRAQCRLFRQRSLQTTRQLSATLCIAGLLSALCLQTPASPVQTPAPRSFTPLELGKTMERELSGKQTHVYQLTLAAGQFLRIAVYQKDVQVVATLIGADGKPLVTADSPNAAFAMESLSWISDAAGNYRLEIRALDADTANGRYEVQLEERRTATAADKERIAAARLFQEAEQLSASSAANALSQARAKYEEALRINRSLNDRLAEAFTLHGLGQAHHRLGDPTKALDSFQQALAIFQSFGNQGWGRLFENLAPLYMIMGGKQPALDYLAQALPLVRALHNHRLEAILLTGVARAYQDLNNPQPALEHYHLALLQYRRLGNRSEEAITLTDIADADLSLAEREKAIAYLQQALPIVRAVGDRSLEATMLFGIGYVYNLLDERQKALEYYEQALPIFRALNDRNSEAYMLSFIGGFYASLGENQKAIDDYELALPLFRALQDRKGEAYTLLRLGAAYRAVEDKQKVLGLLSEALTLMRTTGERGGEALTLNQLGDFYYANGDAQKTLEVFHQALLLWRMQGYRDGEAFTLLNLGFVYEVTGKPQPALDCHQQALALFRALGTRNGEAGALFGLARLAYTRGNFAEARQKMEAALDIIESLRAKLAAQELRAAFLASYQHYYNFYVEVLMQWHQREPAKGFDAEALQAAERARARSLLELLSESRADIRQGVDAKLLERERELQRQLNAREQTRMQLANRKAKPEALAKIEKEIRAITTEYQEVQAQIRIHSPRYAALTQPQPLALKAIQEQALDDDTLFLEYALGNERSYLWAVSSTTIASFVLPKRDVIEQAARTFYQALTAPNQPVERRGAQATQSRAAKTNTQQPTAKISASEAAAALSRMLLAPVAAKLGAKRLLIVADGALQYIPFAALPEPVGSQQSAVGGKEAGGRKEKTGNKPQTRDNGQQTTDNGQQTTDNGLRTTDYGRPLIVEHEIVNLPSASTLAVLRRETQGRNTPLKTLAVLADPVFSLDDARVKRNAPKADGKPAQRTPARTRGVERQLEKSALESGVTNFSLRIPRLVGTRVEAAGILELFPEAQRKQALDFAANRATATSAELGRYSMIHFATHGILNSVHPELSGIVLSLVDEQGQMQDGFLRLHEIYNLRLPVELVVLSACQTGLGKQIRGEGLVGLTRGFMYAGAPRVVASLWKVDDEATAELMKRFYKGIVVEGLRPAAALRAAQVEMWKQPRFAEPYYWAAFILQGEWK